MKKTSLIVIVVLVVAGFLAINFLPSLGGEPGVYVIETSYGKIKVRLYDETPQHRDNFIKQVKEKAYNKTFVNQVTPMYLLAGDIESTSADGQNAERGGSIPSEYNSKYFAKKGALVAMASQSEPNSSVDDQFMLVKGQVYTKEQLIEMEKGKLVQSIADQPENAEKRQKYERFAQQHMEDSALVIITAWKNEADQKYSAGLGKLFNNEQIEAYTTIGGMPQVDGLEVRFTVFGEVIEGMEILEKILSAEADPRTGKPMIEIPLKIKND
jgi:cyclophilin family peptidyl-prolyl cis-trans isomerase